MAIILAFKSEALISSAAAAGSVPATTGTAIIVVPSMSSGGALKLVPGYFLFAAFMIVRQIS